MLKVDIIKKDHTVLPKNNLIAFIMELKFAKFSAEHITKILKLWNVAKICANIESEGAT